MIQTNEPSPMSAVPRGKIAAVATFLDMTQAPAPRSEAASLPGTIDAVPDPDVDAYLDLYRRIGAPHLWYGRLVLPRDRLTALLADPALELFVLTLDGQAEGMAEIDYRMGSSAEIVYFGVSARLVGTGQARRLMNRAIAAAFARPIDRLFLHTNTLDHPKALDFYHRSGFRPRGQSVEIADDPRLTGLLPRDCAPHVPIFE